MATEQQRRQQADWERVLQRMADLEARVKRLEAENRRLKEVHQQEDTLEHQLAALEERLDRLNAAQARGREEELGLGY